MRARGCRRRGGIKIQTKVIVADIVRFRGVWKVSRTPIFKNIRRLAAQPHPRRPSHGHSPAFLISEMVGIEFRLGEHNFVSHHTVLKIQPRFLRRFPDLVIMDCARHARHDTLLRVPQCTFRNAPAVAITRGRNPPEMLLQALRIPHHSVLAPVRAVCTGIVNVQPLFRYVRKDLVLYRSFAALVIFSRVQFRGALARRQSSTVRWFVQNGAQSPRLGRITC
jgi:hypothetical protein